MMLKLFVLHHLLLLLLFQMQVTADGSCYHACEEEGICKSRKVSNTCYYVFTDKQRTWDENKDLCNSNELSMVKLLDERMQDGFTTSDTTDSFEGSSYAWLGGRAKNLDRWTFVNGVPLDQTNNHQPLPGGSAHHQCGVVFYSKTCDKSPTIRLGKDNCHNNYNFICRFDDWETATTAYISERSTNWFGARERCKDLGADLFYLNKSENIQLMKNKLTQSANHTLFIGLSNKVWQWEDGNEAVLRNWQKSRDDIFEKECLMMNLKDGSWNSNDCNQQAHAFCEKELVDGTCDRKQFAVIFALSLVLLVSIIIGTVGWISFLCMSKESKKSAAAKKSTRGHLEDGDELMEMDTASYYCTGSDIDYNVFTQRKLKDLSADTGIAKGISNFKEDADDQQYLESTSYYCSMADDILPMPADILPKPADILPMPADILPIPADIQPTESIQSRKEKLFGADTKLPEIQFDGFTGDLTHTEMAAYPVPDEIQINRLTDGSLT